ncbi:Endonuclease/exonuclease/phosphatase [Irpex rosettiformis]|uniref:Endonuclease/exonuclease/phosphatase n=1 Tax=Irpex rosettiformis TaxID=378272 RepID=A0ACB8UII9_9APHY|nr:Endonuclease/exonuclease/phosphatase [Irpex rosettiformis]
MADDRLRIFTLNCWGLKYVSKNRRERVDAIARFLADSDYDIVTLQELWVFADYEFVRDAVSKNLPHSKFFYSGALGAGLVIFSRFPIIAATVHPYSLNGSPIDVIAGDWFVGKAAASVLIAHPILGHTQIFNTHLFAKGGDEGPDHFKAHRLVGAWEFAKLARQAAEVGRYVIAAGDFNSVPIAPPMHIIRNHADLRDAWDDSHKEVRGLSIAGQPTPIDAIHMYGVTADSPLNSHSAGKPLEPYARKYQGKRLDYVLYRSPRRPNERIPNLECVDTRVLLTENVPGTNYSYSDHFGLEATFEITSPDGEITNSEETPNLASIDGTEVASFTLNSVSNLAKPQQLSPELISSTITSLTARYRFAASQARLHLTIFVLCIGLLFAIIIGTAWLPKSWINPIFTVLTIALSWLATTMLYIGFLYGNWEINALTNIIEELEIYRVTLEERGAIYASRRSIAR